MPRALLTRPRAQSERLARELRDQGWDVDIWPLMDIQHTLTQQPDWQGAQAILFTSANAVRATSQFTQPDAPAFCVGAATARAAWQAGYRRVENAASDVEGLIALVSSRLKPEEGPLWYPHGRDTTGDLGGRLAAAGFGIEAPVAYEAAETGRPAQDIAERLAEGAYKAVALFSPRSSALLAASLTDAQKNGLAATNAIAISAAAAEPLAKLGFASIIIAEGPNAGAVRAAILRSA